MTSASKARKKSTRLLSHGRPLPPTAAKGSGHLSSKVTRSLIRSHHALHKKLRQAEIAGDQTLVQSLEAEIEEHGGLAKYQQASIVGQSADRGGDSSKILIEWLLETEPNLKSMSKQAQLRLLEVGALKIDNACSKCGIFQVERIDLHSQHPDILQQDFMQRPLPSGHRESDNQFDIVSLSLVVNYVPDPVGRGEMLKRVASFLRRQLVNTAGPSTLQGIFPGLFLVLPSPCVTNSRYLDGRRMQDIMESLGYDLLKQKVTSKLVYYYYTLQNQLSAKTFAKRELRTGGKRNNFAIVLE